MIEIKVEVIKEIPAITLRGSDYNGYGDDCEIYWDDLRSAPSGRGWTARCGNSWRDAICQEATLVFRNEEIAVLMIKNTRADDSPNGETSVDMDLRGFQLKEKS